MLTSSSGPGTTTDTNVQITATFPTDVAGVTIADFNGGTPFPVETGITYALSGSGTQWVLTIGIDSNPRTTKALSAFFLAGSGAISPPNQASPTPIVLLYEPPTPIFSSSYGDHGEVVYEPRITFTATFDHAISGLVKADFGVVASNSDVVYTSAVASTDGKKWVLTLTVSDNFAETDFTLTMPRDSGVIVNKNAAASNNGFFLHCACPSQATTADCAMTLC